MCTSIISINIFLRYYKGINNLLYFKKYFYSVLAMKKFW